MIPGECISLWHCHTIVKHRTYIPYNTSHISTVELFYTIAMHILYCTRTVYTIHLWYNHLYHTRSYGYTVCVWWRSFTNCYNYPTIGIWEKAKPVNTAGTIAIATYMCIASCSMHGTYSLYKWINLTPYWFMTVGCMHAACHLSLVTSYMAMPAVICIRM